MKAALQHAEGSLPLGEHLRTARKSAGLTLHDVATGAGLSVSFISQVERGLATPSLSSLASISSILGISIADCLRQPSNPAPHTRNESRPVYGVKPNAFRYERLSSVFPGSQLSSVIIHAPPGSSSEPSRHEGEELFYVLSGELTIVVDGREMVAKSGDSVHFASKLEHAMRNDTDREATAMHVCTMDIFGDKQPHVPMPGSNLHLIDDHIPSASRRRRKAP